VKDCARWAEVVVLAVPYDQVGNCMGEAGEALDGKTLIDVTNVVDDDGELALGTTTSGAEELQRFVPRAKVVKAFNTIHADRMEAAEAHGTPLTVFVASDDQGAKRATIELARDIGFDALDAGPLKSARYLEPMGLLNIAIGHGQQMGTDGGLVYARSGTKVREVEAAPPR
jgi:8-hydroxy-5-deazaflavin:NADPH oxidoreductase